MRDSRLTAVLLFLSSGFVPAVAQNYTPDSLATELQTLREAVDEGRDAVLDGLPAEWVVQAEDRTYRLSTFPLRELPAGDARRDKASIWLSEVEQQIRSYAEQSGRGFAEPRKELAEILARREFAKASPPNALERFRQRVYAAIGRFLDRIFQFAAQHPTGSQILFWAVLIVSIAGLGLWLLRLFRSAEVRSKLPPPKRQEAEVRPWQEWLVAAKKAEEQQDYREAIRCGYWAAVVCLQQQGELPAELTNTPRERLRFAIVPRYREPLAGLTTSLERFWYAGKTAGPEDVQESFRWMEAVECKAD